jgi:PAS domain S-box-containing protein
MVTSRLDEALASAGDGVCAVRSDGRIALWNRSAEKILGYSAREVLGRPCCDIFIGYDDNGNRLCYQGCHVMSLVKLGEPVQSFEMKARTKRGQSVWLSVSLLVMPDAAPALPLVIHLFRDVTATKELLTLVHERLSDGAARENSDGAASLLSRRELEVLRLLASGLNTRAIAERLHVSSATIRNHVQNLFGKLGVHSRLEAVAYASRHRLL